MSAKVNGVVRIMENTSDPRMAEFWSETLGPEGRAIYNAQVNTPYKQSQAPIAATC
jgi:hypothetical protein